MQATRFEYKYRFILHALIYMLGFWAPWVNLYNVFGWTDKSTWIVLSTLLAQPGWLGFMPAVELVLILALIFAALGAWFRTWGSAYVTAGIVQSRDMHGDALLADGPYRHTRNPLYLGTLLHTIGLSIIMCPSGALFAIALLWIFQIRLALAEEPFLATRFGHTYLDYKARVPRFLPLLKPLVPAAGQHAQWLQAILGELYFLGAFLVMAVFGWAFVLEKVGTANPIRQGILISLGLWLITRAFLPQAKKTS